MVTKLRAEGWCTDPFGRHEARWLSDGTPTRLVRDGGVESMDDPAGVPTEEAVPISWGEQIADGADLLRSDRRVLSQNDKFERVASAVLGGGSD